MPRPKLDDDSPTVTYLLRTTEAQKAEAVEAAAEDGVPLGAWIRDAVDRKLKARRRRQSRKG